jgi:hypothetical protein
MSELQQTRPKMASTLFCGSWWLHADRGLQLRQCRWDFENPPRNSEQWSRLVRMAKKNKCEFVSLSPKAAAILYGHEQNWQ